MSTRNLIVSDIQEKGKKGKEMNAELDNMNEVAARLNG